MRSDEAKKGMERAASRALLYSTGVTRRGMKKPFDHRLGRELLQDTPQPLVAAGGQVGVDSARIRPVDIAREQRVECHGRLLERLQKSVELRLVEKVTFFVVVSKNAPLP